MGRFFLGFAIGAALGAAAVVLNARSAAADDRMTLRGDDGGGLKGLLTGALDAGRQAATAREQELRADFRTRLTTRPQPSQLGGV
jgi:gas vesicle protein